MAEIQLDAEALDQFRHDHKGILDAIDSLRGLGVGKLINLPQIVVVGDQSSGKSSVLEAISRVRFPAKGGGRCTRFATELVLRQKPDDEIVVTIRQEGNAKRLPSFNEKSFKKDDLAELVDQARKAMGVEDGSTGFSEDVLRVEISGPTLLPLTLVDLPGFYHNSTSEQPREGIAIVSRLAEKYMRQKNSIILAIISAKSEISQQEVLDEVRKHDPTRERTLGIITKPDTLTTDTTDEERYVQLANNKESSHILKHGWHVLRNRNSYENNETKSENARISDDERDKKETQFLSSGVWASYSSNNKGIGSLRRKLSRILTGHIRANLPSLVQSIEIGLETRKETLKGLGKSRSELVEMRQYLDDIFNRFRGTTLAAVKGTYEGKFFTNTDLSILTEEAVQSDPRKLRAVVRNINRAFVAVMLSNGSKFCITEYDHFQPGTIAQPIPEAVQDIVHQFQVSEPTQITWAKVKSRLELLESNNQGTRFPGSPNDKLALELFREQSERWKVIAKTYIEIVTDATRDFVDLALHDIVPAQGNTREALHAEYIEGFFKQRSDELAAKLDELVKHYEEGDAICLEDLFLQELSRRKMLRAGGQTQNALVIRGSDFTPHETQVVASGHPDMGTHANFAEDQGSDFGLEAIVDMMDSYYSISLRTFMDNVVVLAAENCLMTKLPSILDSKIIYSMDEETLKDLAGETADVKWERTILEQEIDLLREGLPICKKYLPRRSTGRASTNKLSSHQPPEEPMTESTTSIKQTSIAAPKSNGEEAKSHPSLVPPVLEVPPSSSAVVKNDSPPSSAITTKQPEVSSINASPETTPSKSLATLSGFGGVGSKLADVPNSSSTRTGFSGSGLHIQKPANTQKTSSTPIVSGLFGSNPTNAKEKTFTPSPFGLFGANTQKTASTNAGLFGSPDTLSTGGPLFRLAASSESASTGVDSTSASIIGSYFTGFEFITVEAQSNLEFTGFEFIDKYWQLFGDRK